MPIVANGRSDSEKDAQPPSPSCQLAAVEFLEDVLVKGCVVLDVGGEIEAEYRRYLSPRGQPGVGDRFYLEVLNSAPGRVERVDLPKGGDTEYRDFPNVPELSEFDPSDRKFAAVACREKIPVANATDSDWLIHRFALEANGIAIRFVCGRNRRAWFTQRETSAARHGR